jgi:hypothetical protein
VIVPISIEVPMWLIVSMVSWEVPVIVPAIIGSFDFFVCDRILARVYIEINDSFPFTYLFAYQHSV